MISIALASFNGEKYISEQLDSILSQTIQDFEVVICDDCSNDSTWIILREYAKKDKRIKIYRNSENIGFKKNFEKAISLCKGEYIALSDQDDIWTSNHLDVLLGIIGNNSVACGNAQIINEFGVDKGYDLRFLEGLDKVYNDNLDVAYRILLNKNPFQGASMLINRLFLTKALPIPEGVNYHDAWFAALSCVEGRFVYTSTIINKYRQHSDNVTSLVEKTFFNRIKHFTLQTAAESDRSFYCKAITERLNKEKMSGVQLQFIDNVSWYYNNISKRRYRLALAFFRFKHYSKIYSTSSKKLFLIRLIKFLFT